MWTSCVCVSKLCVCVKVVCEEAGGGGGGGGGRRQRGSAQPKTWSFPGERLPRDDRFKPVVVQSIYRRGKVIGISLQKPANQMAPVIRFASSGSQRLAIFKKGAQLVENWGRLYHSVTLQLNCLCHFLRGE